MTTDKTVVQRTAHAKINLSLHVTGKRADGYHLLDSLVGFAAFGDLITVQAANHDAFALQGPLAKALADEPPENNLVLRARDWLRAQSGEPRPPVRVTLDKHLPTASGIGGGSADAAATLIALAKIWCTPADILADSAAIAEALGADVPMCVHQTPLRVTGIGEVLAPWHRLPTLPLVLVNPGDAVSTPDVFNALTKPDNDALHAMPPAFANPAEAALWLAEHTRNDLQPAAIPLCPPIRDCLAALQESGAVLARMSGSGATCFGIYENAVKAQTAGNHLAKTHPTWFVQATAILPSPPLRDEDYPAWANSMKAVRSLH